MSWLPLVYIAVYVLLLLVLAQPLGRYIARVYSGERHFLSGWGQPCERTIYRLCGIDCASEMTWFQYARAILALSFVSFCGLYTLQRSQGWWPYNPTGCAAVPPDLAFNTAISFVTNTNWQSYAGESTMSHLTEMLGLTVQNFVSAAVGMAVLIAFVRGFTNECSDTIGNFWIDFVRGVLYILLPLSGMFAIVLISQGVVQSWGGKYEYAILEARATPAVGVTSSELDSVGSASTSAVSTSAGAEDKEAVRRQSVIIGPVASQVAIKQLGTNGGGFYNTNAAHPYENPTALSNFLQLIAILLLPAALCFAFGELIHDPRQGRALLAAMLSIFMPLTLIAWRSEQVGNPRFSQLGVDQHASAMQTGGNMEGKEARFGVASSALWAVATTAASNGSVNSMHDSFTPLGGLIPLWLIQLGEVIFGGVGSGLYGMLIFAMITVFIAGLMVGRTPEYLGKKIGAFEIKMAALVILFPCSAVLLGTAWAVLNPHAAAGIFNAGPHGFSEVLYAFSSAANNNGSAFAGLSANSFSYNLSLGLAMFVGRFWVMIPVLALAGSLARQRPVPSSPGTLPTHTPLFVVFLIAVILLVGALSFFPALALGPIVEELWLFEATPSSQLQ